MYAPLRTWLGLELLEVVVSCAGFMILLHGIGVLQLYVCACRICLQSMHSNTSQALRKLEQAGGMQTYVYDICRKDT